MGEFVYIQEEEERKRKEEQERKEHEEYLLLKEQFTVEEEGVGETAEEVSDCILLTVRERCKQDSLMTTCTYYQMTSCSNVLVVSNKLKTVTDFAVLLVKATNFTLVYKTVDACVSVL